MDEHRMPQGKHAEALATLTLTRYGQMVGFARKRLRREGVPISSADPEDLVQNAFRSVLQCDGLISNMRAYVYKAIAHEVNRAVKCFRTGRGYESLDADVQLEHGPASHPITTVDLRLVLADAVRALPVQQRRVMLLTHEMGLTQAEAARVLGTTTGTVGTHIHRAFQALRVTLVGVGATLVAWTTASMAFGVRPIIPAAGPETELSHEVVRSLFVTVGFVAIVVGLVIYAPGRQSSSALRRMRVGMRQLLTRLVDDTPSRSSGAASDSSNANNAPGRASYIDPADQWVLNPDTGAYELHLTPPARAAAPVTRTRPGTRSPSTGDRPLGRADARRAAQRQARGVRSR